MSRREVALPQQLDGIFNLLREHRSVLRERYRVRSLGIFGSWVRGEQTRRSDLDILVEIDDDALTLFQFVELRDYLSELLGVRVDLVERSTLKPHIEQRVLQEVVAI
ncbi:MAG: nucleotidyltransferase family protein [Anaerolineae bacterium]